MAILSEVSRKFKDKECQMCGRIYSPTGSCSKFCMECIPESRKALARKGAQDYRIRHRLVKKPGVGKGGNTKTGKDHHSYKNGTGIFYKDARRIREERKHCERCGKDLLGVGRYEWCVHHKDHNRQNNVDENYELLCKRCHQIEHDCQNAFTKTCND
jgi:hypothetical protein